MPNKVKEAMTDKLPALPPRPLATEEEMRLAIRLCNSNGLLVIGVSAEMAVTDLIVDKRTQSNRIADLEREIREAHIILLNCQPIGDRTAKRAQRWLKRFRRNTERENHDNN